MITTILMLLAATLSPDQGVSGDPVDDESTSTALAVSATVSPSLRLSTTASVTGGEVVTIAESANAAVSAVGGTVTQAGGGTIVTADGPMTITIEY